MGYVNVIWQADANANAIQMLEQVSTPPEVINIAGSQILKVRDTCEQLAECMGKSVRFSGHEATDALLSNAGKCISSFGNPQHESDLMIRWTANWVLQGGEHSSKPTHFSNREGKFCRHPEATGENQRYSSGPKSFARRDQDLKVGRFIVDAKIHSTVWHH